MPEDKITVFSLLCATALALHTPGPARANGLCPSSPVAQGPGLVQKIDGARHPSAAATEIRATDDPQYRLVGRAQYRLADNPQYRLANDPQYRLVDARDRHSGEMRYHTSRSEAQSVPPRITARAAKYRAIVKTAAHAEGIEPELLHAVIATESGYNPAARSQKGAMGLMQLMPAVALHYSVIDPSQPAQNVAAGAKHLRYLLDAFDNDLSLALAAYNAGEQAVRKHCNRVPPYAETRNYVLRVLAFYRHDLALQRNPPL